jgi:threonine aldolase
MRQVGYLAAAGIYDHNVERLAEDHRRAKELANVLAKTSWVSSVEPVETNILIFHWQLTAVIRFDRKIKAKEYFYQLDGSW